MPVVPTPSASDALALLLASVGLGDALAESRPDPASASI
jgi:hypothetical protein